MEARITRPRSLVGPVILIAAGSAFLANNLGLMDRGMWEMLIQLWPIILVGLGLDILLRRSSGGSLASSISLAVALVVMLAVGAGVALAAPRVTLSDHGLIVTSDREQAQEVRLGGPVHSESFAQSLGGAERATVELNLGLGRSEIGTMSQSANLVEGTLSLAEDETAKREYTVSGGTGYFSLSNHTQSAFHGERGAAADRGSEIRLNRSLPIALKVNAGLSSARMDLSDLQLTSLELNGGISKTEVTIPRAGQFNVTINGGLSQIKVMVPHGMAARIQTERGLSSVDVKGDYRHTGNTYVSPNYDSARDRVEMIIQGGIGKITIQEM